MFSLSLRSVSRNGPVAARSLSSTAATRAAEVKSLGVVGAGQMVSRALSVEISCSNDV